MNPSLFFDPKAGAFAGLWTLVCFGLAPAPAQTSMGSPVEELLSDVRSIAAPGSPGSLVVFGENAHVLVAHAERTGEAVPVAAVSQFGAGRIGVFGHTGYLAEPALETGETRKLMRNLALWVTRNKSGARAALWGDRALEPELKSLGFEVSTQREFEGLDLVVTALPAGIDAGRIAGMRQWLEKGGALICAGTGWGWMQLNPGKSLARDHEGNQVLLSFGIAFGSDSLSSGPTNRFAVSPRPPRTAHARAALEELLAADKTKKSGGSSDGALRSTLLAATRALPDDEPLVAAPLRARAEARAAEWARTPPRQIGNSALDALAVAWLDRRWSELPAAEIEPAPTVAQFPGAVPKDAPRSPREVTLTASAEGWLSLGLYAPPGEVVSFEALGDAPPPKAALRIGAHTDGLWELSNWNRWPSVSRRFSWSGRSLSIASPHGGLLYVEGLPAGTAFRMKVTGAVSAARFVLGESDPETWPSARGAAAAPWGEIEGKHIVHTVRAADLVKVKDPAALAAWWDSVWEAHSELLGEPIHAKRSERIVADIQISAGYMHSGYPIMTHLDGGEAAMDLEKLKKEGSWGHFHELGHNSQRSAWTFDGTGEVTCNLFTLHAMEKLCGIDPVKHPWFGANFAQKVEVYLANPDFEKWKSDPAVALWFFVEMQQAYGWKAFRTFFDDVRARPAPSRPHGDLAKRDLWLTGMSKVTGRNLAPLFDRWGVPVSEKARTQVAALPAHSIAPPRR
ncbi:MAG: hypothetical protein JNJ88_01635 [Planctomycetes bacterium]|nr:hypothetical protein [Planctomycetota bacterium]